MQFPLLPRRRWAAAALAAATRRAARVRRRLPVRPLEGRPPSFDGQPRRADARQRRGARAAAGLEGGLGRQLADGARGDRPAEADRARRLLRALADEGPQAGRAVRHLPRAQRRRHAFASRCRTSFERHRRLGRDRSRRTARHARAPSSSTTSRSEGRAAPAAQSFEPRMKRVHYAWIVAAVGFVTLITAAGFRSTTRRADRAAAGRVRLEPRDDRLRGLRQPDPLRARRPVRGGARRALRAAARDRSSRCSRSSTGSSLTIFMNAAVAARPALGRRQRARDRRDLGAARGADREPLVRAAARARHRHPDRVERHRPADLPAAARLDRRALRLALRRRHGRRGRARASCCRSSLLFMRDRPADLGLAPYGDRDPADRRRPSGNPFRAPSRACSARLALDRRSGCSPAASSSAARRRTA